MGMAGTGIPWQLESKTIEEQFGYLLASGIWSDCTFVVGPKTNQAVIQAHKLVMTLASPVFEAMFPGGPSADNKPIIPIPEVQPEVFRALLPYIYTSNVTIDSFGKAIDLWYGAIKFMMPGLAKKCKSYVMSVLGPKNACRAYEISYLFLERTLVDKCVEIISINTKEVINDSSFEDVEFDTLMTVLSLDNLNVDELDLFYAVERYAKAQEQRTQNDPEDEEQPSKMLPKLTLGQTTEGKVLVNVESIPEIEVDSKKPAKESQPAADNEKLMDVPERSIREALQKIRFLTLTPQQFTEGPARSNLLTKDESLALLMNIASSESPVPMPPGFSECRERRQPPKNSVPT